MIPRVHEAFLVVWKDAKDACDIFVDSFRLSYVMERARSFLIESCNAYSSFPSYANCLVDATARLQSSAILLCKSSRVRFTDDSSMSGLTTFVNGSDREEQGGEAGKYAQIVQTKRTSPLLATFHKISVTFTLKFSRHACKPIAQSSLVWHACRSMLVDI